MFHKKDNIRLAQKELLKIFAAITALIMVGVAYYAYLRHDAYHLAEKRAELTLKNVESIIRMRTGKIETIVNSIQPMVEYAINDPDAMFDIARHTKESSQNIIGTGIAFKENYYPEKGFWFEVYVGYQKGGDTLVTAQIGSTNHDYLQMDWFKKGMKATKGIWIDPYYDNAGGKTILMTYCVPFRDKTGQVAGVIGADVTLDTLTNILQSSTLYPHSFCSLVSGNGTVIVSPGSQPKGKFHVFTQRIEDKNMVLTLTIPDSDMYKRLRQTTLLFVLLAITGILSVFFIAYRAVQNIRKLNEVEIKEQQIENELSIARNIQESLLPSSSLPNLSRQVDICGLQVPAKFVGGDLYDFYIRDNKLIFCIGDVSGKGVPAALLMAIAHSLFRTISAHSGRPDRIAMELNRSISENNPDIMFITMFLGVMDLSTGKTIYCNAGHNPPILIKGGHAEFLNSEPSLLLGVDTSAEYTAHEMDLSPGDTLLLYTDGLTEAENEQEELFGEARALGAATAGHLLSAQELLKQLQDTLQQFVNQAEQSDDLTMLAIRYTPDEGETLTLANEIRELEHLKPFLDNFFKQNKIDISLLPNVNLALEEALANVIMYAYPKGTHGDVTLSAKVSDNVICMEINDTGVPFNPLQKKEANLDVPLEERQIGGLGIHLIKEIMDDVEYGYEDGKNVLRMKKQLRTA